jgi:hypothetical protein
MLKIIFYVASALAYTILFVEYAKAPIWKLLSEHPRLPVDLISWLFFVPTIIFGALALDAYKNPKKNHAPQLQAAQTGPFQKLWAGEMPMWHAFWGYHMPVTGFFAFVGNYAIARFGSEGSGRSVLVLVFFFIICLGYHILTISGTWRSSRRYTGSRIWAVLVRIGVIVSSICTALALTLTLTLARAF